MSLQSRREQELDATPKLKKYWTVIEKRDSKADVEARKRLVIILRITIFIVYCVSRNQKERRFLFNIILKFFNVLEGIPLTGILYILVRGVPIIKSADISATDLLIFSVLVISTGDQIKPIQLPI